MKCEHCGHEQSSGRFCDACGLVVTQVPVSRPQETPVQGEVVAGKFTCRYCGHQQSDSRICAGCGMMLDIFRALPDEDTDTSAPVHRLWYQIDPNHLPELRFPHADLPTEEE